MTMFLSRVAETDIAIPQTDHPGKAMCQRHMEESSKTRLGEVRARLHL